MTMTEYFHYISYKMQDRCVKVFARDSDSENGEIRLIANDVTSVENAKRLIKALELEENERLAREKEVREKYEESLKAVHSFQRVSVKSLLCECGKYAEDNIHFLASRDHIYRHDHTQNTTSSGLCLCGRTRNDPRHVEESEL